MIGATKRVVCHQCSPLAPADRRLRRGTVRAESMSSVVVIASKSVTSIGRQGPTSTAVDWRGSARCVILRASGHSTYSKLPQISIPVGLPSLKLM